MGPPVVFIAASPQQFDQARYAEKFARLAEAEVLNPVVSLPRHLAQCCYLPIELAMLEASDMMWLLPNSMTDPVVASCIHYARAQHITIILDEKELVEELNKYSDNEQILLGGWDEEG